MNCLYCNKILSTRQKKFCSKDCYFKNKQKNYFNDSFVLTERMKSIICGSLLGDGSLTKPTKLNFVKSC
jgi:hypothetical protein